MKVNLNKKRSGGMKSERVFETMQCYLMLSTQIIGFLVLTIYPILWTFKWGFFSYNGVASQTRFIGMDNFITMFTTDITYWKTWLNTLILTFLKLPVEIPLAMITALMLNSKIKCSGLFRSIFYLPHIISVAIIGLIFSNMFSYWGLINTFLKDIGLISSEIDWFSNAGPARGMLTLMGVWMGYGVNVMYFLAALTNVPEELYESAKLDGASAVRTFFSITLPSITSVFKIVLLMAIVASLGMNEAILVTTNGAPSGSTLTVMAYLTNQFVPGFAETTTPALGYGCAMSLITTIIFGIVAFLYNKLSNKIDSTN